MRKKDRSGLYIVIFILAIVGIFLGFYYAGKQIRPSGNYDYNHFKFYKSKDIWYTQIQMNDQLQTIPFYYHPKDLEDIFVENNVVAKVFRPGVELILITLDPDGGAIPGQAGVQISRLTGQRFNIYNTPTLSALTRMDESINLSNTSKVVRIATCKSVNETTSVIYIRIGERNIIYSQDECVILEGKTAQDTLRVAERFDYEMLGIMKT